MPQQHSRKLPTLIDDADAASSEAEPAAKKRKLEQSTYGAVCVRYFSLHIFLTARF